MTLHRGLSAVLLCSLALASTTAEAGCEKDTDCKGDRICVDSACADPAPAEPRPAQDPPPVDGAEEANLVPPPAEDPAVENAWWKKDVREQEAALLQELFNELPKPVRTKGAGKLVYQRSVPLVISDIHDVTAVWGSKLQRDVHFLGISKVHTTQAMASIGPDTAGIPYCPLACNRISQIFVNDDEITLQYDGPIKDWAGKAADNVAGYTRRFGKVHQAKCSFPIMVKHAPPNTWLDPEQVARVRTAVVAEIKRYCAQP